MADPVKSGDFCFDPDELGAPDASHPVTLFDWQGQNDLKVTFAKFGGVENIAKSLGTDLKRGLTSTQVNDPLRIQKYGSNKPEVKKGVTYWELIWEGLHDFTLLVLITAAVVSIITGGFAEGWETGWIDGVAILIAVVIILNVSAINDLQKDKQFRQLNAINNRKKIKCVRDGETIELVVDDIVCGDLLFITAGDTIPADLLYVTGTNVKMDESKLTGEPDQLKKNEEKPFIVSSSECHDGSFYGIVVAVGPYSVFGKMKTMIEGGGDEETPLQLKLEKLTTVISMFGAAVGAIVIVVMLIIHLVEYFTGNGTTNANGDPEWKTSNWNSIVHFFITGIAILVVAIPEGLPLAVTIALAYSVKRMMIDNNLVRHLSACETMGGANTICSDKTGTLTLGQMTVMQGWIYNDSNDDDTAFLNKFQLLNAEERNEFINNYKKIPDELKKTLVENSCLNNDAFLIKEEDKPERGNGSSLDIALIKFTRELGDEYEYNNVRNKYPKDEPNGPAIVKSYPFHSNRKRSSVVIRKPDGTYRIYVKGAPEMLIRLCDYVVSNKGEFRKMNGNFIGDSSDTLSGDGTRFMIVKHCILPMASTGLRVIALAFKDFKDKPDWEETVEYQSDECKGVGPCPALESGLTLAGLIGVQDPPRAEVPASVKDCQKAGIFVRMVTGDNIETAKAIAKQVNIYHKDGYTDGQGRKWPPGKTITGPQFRELVGGLVLPPHFNHECKCKDLSSDPAFKEGYLTPKHPIHFGYPSIVGHISNECQYWQNNPKATCNDECKQRGCIKDIKKAGDKTEEQKYLVIKNQYVFDQFVDTLQVMARSAPTDKHMLVTGLMERRLVVAVTGDGTNDGPALRKSNVGFAMGIAGTSIAKDASDIILMDDNFTSIVKAVLWGRNVYDSIRKFLQFQLTVNMVACLLAVISAVVIKESPLKPVQMLWVNLIMDTFASLALATEYPTLALLDRPPYHRDESLISKCMFRNILGHFFFQFTVVMVSTFSGHEILGYPTGTHLSTEAPATAHFTFVFNVFVFMQVFNEINARKINNEMNVFKNIFSNYMFLSIVIGTFLVQILIVSVGGRALGVKPLQFIDHLVSFIIGFFSLVVQQLLRFVPPHWFYDLGRGELKEKSGIEFLQRARSRLHSNSLPTVAGDMPQPGRQKIKLFE